ncbi:hypothetical protein [Mesorhizobium sp. A623]
MGGGLRKGIIVVKRDFGPSGRPAHGDISVRLAASQTKHYSAKTVFYLKVELP